MESTWIAPEEHACPNGGQTRKARVIIRANEKYAPVATAFLAPTIGAVRTVYAGIPDTYFSIPAHLKYKGRYVRGYVSSDDGTLIFTPYERKADKAKV